MVRVSFGNFGCIWEPKTLLVLLLLLSSCTPREVGLHSMASASRGSAENVNIQSPERTKGHGRGRRKSETSDEQHGIIQRRTVHDALVHAKNATISHAISRESQSNHSTNHSDVDGEKIRRSGMCQHLEGCPRKATHGDQHSRFRLFCSLHRFEHHTDKKHILCSAVRCKKQGIYVDLNDPNVRFCQEHNNLTVSFRCSNKKVCRIRGCVKRAAYGDLKARSAEYCAQHRQENHVDFLHKRCKHPACNRQASFGDPVERKALHCAQHRLKNDIDVRSRRCQSPGCSKVANFGSPGHVVTHCKEHARPEHLNIKHLKLTQSQLLFNDEFSTVRILPGTRPAIVQEQ